MNVVTGKINNDLSVNVDGRIWSGKDQMKSKSLPGGFYDTISGKMKTMANGKKGVKAGKKIMFDPKVT